MELLFIIIRKPGMFPIHPIPTFSSLINLGQKGGWGRGGEEEKPGEAPFAVGKEKKSRIGT